MHPYIYLSTLSISLLLSFFLRFLFVQAPLPPLPLPHTIPRVGPQTWDWALVGQPLDCFLLCAAGALFFLYNQSVTAAKYDKVRHKFLSLGLTFCRTGPPQSLWIISLLPAPYDFWLHTHPNRLMQKPWLGMGSAWTYSYLGPENRSDSY